MLRSLGSSLLLLSSELPLGLSDHLAGVGRQTLPQVLGLQLSLVRRSQVRCVWHCSESTCRETWTGSSTRLCPVLSSHPSGLIILACAEPFPPTVPCILGDEALLAALTAGFPFITRGSRPFAAWQCLLPARCCNRNKPLFLTWWRDRGPRWQNAGQGYAGYLCGKIHPVTLSQLACGCA